MKQDWADDSYGWRADRATEVNLQIDRVRKQQTRPRAETMANLAAAGRRSTFVILFLSVRIAAPCPAATLDSNSAVFKFAELIDGEMAGEL